MDLPPWLMLAMATSFLYAIINHLDKTLLDRLELGGPEVILIVSCLFAAFGIPYAIYMEPGVLDINPKNVGIMLLVAILNVTLLFCYLKAMDQDEPTVVVLYYQLVPVFTLVMGYFVLRETITQNELIAMALVIIGTSVASFERSELSTFSFKWGTCGLMVLATLCWATEMTIGKIVILEESVYHSIFWEAVMMVIVGFAILIARPKSRRAFKKAFKVNSKVILLVMIFGEALYALGNTLVSLASEIKEVALVMLTQPIQTIFVFIIGMVLAKFFPAIYTQSSVFRRVQLAVAIAITVSGSYMLLL